jgi:hypothetical protein
MAVTPTIIVGELLEREVLAVEVRRLTGHAERRQCGAQFDCRSGARQRPDDEATACRPTKSCG